jgi:hypothetical protein
MPAQGIIIFQVLDLSNAGIDNRVGIRLVRAMLLQVVFKDAPLSWENRSQVACAKSGHSPI